MNKYKLTPVITLTREDAQLEEMNDQVAQLLKDPSMNDDLKMAFFENLMAKIRSFRDTPKRSDQEPSFFVRETRATQTPKKAVRRKEYEVADVPSQTENRRSDGFTQTEKRTIDSSAQTPHEQGDYEEPLGYSPVLQEEFRRTTPKQRRNSVVFSSQSTASSPVSVVTTNSPFSARTANSLTSVSTANSPLARPSPQSTPVKRETRTDFFDRLSKGGRRDPTRASPQKTRSFTGKQQGNGFISKKRWIL